MGEFSKKETVKKRVKYVIIVFIFSIITFLCVISNVNSFRNPPPNRGTPFPGHSNNIEVDEIFFCDGPDENQLPIKPRDYLVSNNIEDIYICPNVLTSEPSAIFARWFNDDYSGSFAMNPDFYVYDDSYLYFSLTNALDFTSKTLVGKYLRNYLREETDLGFLPVGNYYVEISQGREVLGTIYFQVSNNKP